MTTPSPTPFRPFKSPITLPTTTTLPSLTTLPIYPFVPVPIVNTSPKSHLDEILQVDPEEEALRRPKKRRRTKRQRLLELQAQLEQHGDGSVECQQQAEQLLEQLNRPSGRKRRRIASELVDSEKWFCPYECGKFYRKTSTRSIFEHQVECRKKTLAMRQQEKEKEGTSMLPLISTFNPTLTPLFMQPTFSTLVPTFNISTPTHSTSSAINLPTQTFNISTPTHSTSSAIHLPTQTFNISTPPHSTSSAINLPTQTFNISTPPHSTSSTINIPTQTFSISTPTHSASSTINIPTQTISIPTQTLHIPTQTQTLTIPTPTQTLHIPTPPSTINIPTSLTIPTPSSTINIPTSSFQTMHHPSPFSRNVPMMRGLQFMPASPLHLMRPIALTSR